MRIAATGRGSEWKREGEKKREKNITPILESILE